MSGRRTADEAVATAAERAALGALRATAGTSDGALERHSLRVFELATRIAPRADREVLLVAALLHDVGILEPPGGAAYVTKGRERAAALLAPYGWDAERVRRCLDAIERHHALRSQAGHGAEVEAIRRADLVELSGGLLAAGVPRAERRAIGRAIPRRGLTAQLARLVGRQALRAPVRLLAIFAPPAR